MPSALWGRPWASGTVTYPALNLPAGTTESDVVSFAYDASELSLVAPFTDRHRGLTTGVDIEVGPGGTQGVAGMNNPSWLLPDGTYDTTVGIPQNAVVVNQTSRPIDFATIVMVWNIERIGPNQDPNTDCVYQLVPTRSFPVPTPASYQPVGPFDLTVRYTGGPYDGLGLEMGFVTGDPITDAVFQTFDPEISDTHQEWPFRAYDLRPVRILQPQDSATILVNCDSGVPDSISSSRSLGKCYLFGGFYAIRRADVLLDRLVGIVAALISSGDLTTTGLGVDPLDKLESAAEALAAGDSSRAAGQVRAFLGMSRTNANSTHPQIVISSQAPVDRQFLEDAADTILSVL